MDKGAELPRGLDPEAIHHLPLEVQTPYLQAFGDAVHAAFLMAAGVMLLAFLLSLFMPESPLRNKNA